jgi:hypothetical protein
METEPTSEQPVHTLDLHGEGFFSRGSCTGCAWSSRGHAEDIRRRWDEYHPGGGAQVIELPRRVVVPPPHESPDVQLLEQRIIVLLTHKIDFKRQEALLVAAGVAQARSLLLKESSGVAEEYVSILMARIAHLSRRQREKLRHPTRTRAEQQKILEDV